MLQVYVKMQILRHRVANLLKRQEGQGMVEYSLIIGLVAIAVITVLALMGDEVVRIFDQITGELRDKVPQPTGTQSGG